jgi:GntR family transcriptional regulator
MNPVTPNQNSPGSSANAPAAPSSGATNATHATAPAAANAASAQQVPAATGNPPAVAPAGIAPTFSPLYQQIKALITQSLQSGEWKPGEMIPSEVELANRYKVSQGTVRKAIDELAADNLVMRRQGKGTFVSTHHEARAHIRFLRLRPDEGQPHYPASRFLEVKRLRAPADVARLLDLKTGDPTVYIKRLQSFDGVPTIVEELWLPGQLFKGLTAERLSEYKGPMYGLFESEFGTRMIRADEKVRAVLVTEEDAALLDVASGTPLLAAERVSYTYGDRPVELRRGLYLTTRHHYQNDLN